MKKRDFILFAFWVAFPLIIIFSQFLCGCSPAAIKVSEEIAEEVIEEELKGEK